MDEVQALLDSIERFTLARQMAESTFGRKAVGNSKLLRRLRSGQSITLKTAAAIRAFIAAHSEPTDGGDDAGVDPMRLAS